MNRILGNYMSIKNFMIKMGCLIFLFSFFFVDAQLEIDIERKLDSSKLHFSRLEYIKSIKIADQALQLSKKRSYSKGSTLANIYIAKALSETGIYKNALVYLEYAEMEPFFKIDMKAQVETYRLRGRIYANLEMKDFALREFYKQLKFSSQIEDPLSRKRSILWAHQNIAETFSQINRRDSVWKHLMIQKQILKSFPKNNLDNVYYDLSTTYTSIGKGYLYRKDVKNARIYIDSAMTLLTEYRSPYLYQTLRAYGDLEDAVGNTEAAVKYYEEALQNTIQLQNKDAEKFENKILADYFSKHKLDDKKENQFLKRYQELSDSLNLENHRVNELAINGFLKKKDVEYKYEKRYYSKIFATFLVLLIGIVTFLYYQNHKRKNRLMKIEGVLKEKDHVVESLVSDINTNKFNEMILLGKRYDPQFIILFKELYPEFISKLNKLDPRIKTSELIFCAMIYLNFSTKHISEYSHVTIRAVQIRKNRLRKKYNIDSHVDLSRWMRNL